MLIAIDHGNKQVKTVHGNAIVSGVQKSKTRPYGRDVLKYGGSYYTLSAQRIPYQKDKTTDERFFILSLFAIAEEIEAQGAYTSGLMPIDLAIGLPPAHFGAQNKAFVRYFKRKEPIYFSYRDKLYSILIRDVQCYPQAFAAADSHDTGRAGNGAACADSGRGRLHGGLSAAEERPRRPVYL